MDNLNIIAVRLGIISIEDMDCFTTEELLYLIIHKLNEVIDQVNLNSIYITSEYVIADPTGSDDTKYLQSILDSGKSIISLPGQTFKVTQPLKMTTNDQYIDLNGSTIEFKQSQTVPHSTGDKRVNDVGIINIKSNNQSTVYTVGSADMNAGVIYIANTSGLSIGDWLKLEISSYDTLYDTERLTPTWRVLTKVLNINDTAVHIDYSCDAYNITSGNCTGTATKVVPIENVSVRNVVLKDITPLRNEWVSNISDQYPNEDSHYACAGIASTLAVNCHVDNVIHDSGMYNTIMNQYIAHCTFNNIVSNKPRLIGPGEGYAIQNNSSTDVIISNVQGYRNRHILDITSGGHIVADNLLSVQAQSSDIQLHGRYEHDIIIRNLHGDGQNNDLPLMNVGSGTSFGNASANVTLENCQVNYIGNKTKYVQNLRMDKCLVNLTNTSNDMTITNSEVNISGLAASIPVYRGKLTKLVFDNCKIKLYANNTISHYNVLKFIGCDIYNGTDTDSEIGINFAHCTNVTVSDNNIDCTMWIRHNNVTWGDINATYIFDGNNIACYRYGGIFFTDNDTSNIMANITNNIFYTSPRYTGKNTPFAIRFGGTTLTTSTLRLVVVGNNMASKQNNVSALGDNATVIIDNNII